MCPWWRRSCVVLRCTDGPSSNCSANNGIPLDYTVKPHYDGSLGTSNFYLLLVDFCYCQFMKKRKAHSWNWKTVSIISGMILLVGLVKWGATVVSFSLFCSYRGLLECLGFPMIGSTATAYALSKDKGLTRSVLSPMKFMPNGLIIKRYASIISIPHQSKNKLIWDFLNRKFEICS